MLLRRGPGAGLPILFFAVLLAEAAPASAQYFGRQKVQYETFDWQIIDTDRFEIHFYPATATATQDAARMAERWYERLARAFQHEFDKKPLIFYADHPDFQQTNTTFGQLTEGTGGFTEALRNRVVMPYTGVYADTDHVLGHELVHVFQYDLAQSPGGGGLQGMGRLPLWLIEGMAEYLSLGREDAHTAMWMRDAALRGELPTIRQLTRDQRFFPYRYGQALWAYVAGRWGDRSVPEVYRFATRMGFELALERVLGVTHEQLSEDWITSIRATYLPLIEGRQRPEHAGERILYDPDAGAMHLSPVVSPDGRFVAFFGRREIFTVDLYVADAVTGEIVHRLTSPNRDQHFDALSFIQSAGTWSPDGSKFAFVVFAQGDNQIAIMDIASRRIERSYVVEGVGAVQSPAWSPDGTRIAFTGMAGGLSDIYVLRLADGEVRQLSADRHAYLHPAWSPDATTIAFVTDRDSDFERLTYGNMRIGLMDAATGQVRVLELFERGKHTNPQFTPDGTELYFIADPHGFSDLYRLELASGTVHQVTRLATGVSGITALSPAMSVAQRSGRIMFSVFENSGTNIYALDLQQARGEPVELTVPRIARAAVLPPVEAHGGGLVYEYLEDAVTGLPEPQQFATRPYRTRIGLDFIGPPSFGVGVSEFGAGIAGGVSFYFSDMLGDNQIAAVVQANGTLRDVGAQAQYMNMSRRWNWGAIAGHVPYLTGFTYFDGDRFTGTGDLNQVLERIYVQQIAGVTQYPFTQTRRFEAQLGLTRYAFHQEAITYSYFGGVPTGQVVMRELDAPDPLHFAEASIAYVGDNSFFAFTGPVAGQRFRFEISPTFGSYTFQTALADYRRYLMVQPVTLAGRVMHYGRYGRDAEVRLEDGRFFMPPIYLGYEPLVRGYSRESFEISRECARTTDQPTEMWCPAFERLIGTRIAVANLELRIPLFGVPEYGLINFPYLPLEVSPFFDAGVAWSGDDTPTLEFTRRSPGRVPVFSTGVSARANILGYLVLEAYYAYPFQRPDKGWHWGFQVAPGW
jgi:Tol biopolymer transport system component